MTRRIPPSLLLRIVVMLTVVATCVDGPTAPTRTAGPARVALAPLFSRDAEQIAGRLADFGLVFDNVRIVIVRPLADTVADTTIAFRPGQPDRTLDLVVPARSGGEVFAAS